MQNAKGPNLQAEQIPAQNTVYQSGIPYGGQQIVGQPVYYQQYQQNYGLPQQQNYQTHNYTNGYPPPGQIGTGYQQVVYVGNQPSQVIITQTQINPLLVAELELRHATKYFYGCNCLCGVFVLILLILRCIILFQIQDDSDSRASGILFIIGDCIWVISASLGIYGVSHYKERFLLHYQIGLVLSVIMDIIGTVVAITAGNNTIGVFIFFFLAMFIIYFLFIRSARNIRYKMQSIEILRNQQIQNGQQIGNMNPHQIQNNGPILVQ